MERHLKAFQSDSSVKILVVLSPSFNENDRIKFDLKEITGSGKNVIDNNLKKAKKQAENFVIDVTNAEITINELYRQINSIYRSGRRGVNIMILKDGENILEIIKKRN